MNRRLRYTALLGSVVLICMFPGTQSKSSLSAFGAAGSPESNADTGPSAVEVSAPARVSAPKKAAPSTSWFGLPRSASSRASKGKTKKVRGGSVDTEPYYLKPRKPAVPGDRVWRAVEAAWSRHAELFPERSEWVRAGVETELQKWATTPMVDRPEIRRAGKTLGQRERTLFVFLITKGTVRLIHNTNKGYRKILRLKAYEQLFEYVAQRDPELDVVFWASPSDNCPGNVVDKEDAAWLGLKDDGKDVAVEFPHVPVFCFQRQTNNTHAALIPEIEMLYSNYYDGYRLDDDFLGTKKFNLAFFRGAPTGYGRGIRNQRARLCSRHYLDENNNIKQWTRTHMYERFNCGVVVAKDEQWEVLGNLGAKVSSSISWLKTLKYRYLVSMDGFGATCSRVFKVLHSNSVLLKLESVDLPKSELFYFAGLRAWEHFVPIQEYNIMETVDFLRQNDHLSTAIAAAATTFAKNEITREKCIEYTHLLLSTYSQLLGKKDRL